MNLPRQLIERKLSAMLGAAVTFESLSASVLGGGAIEARGVRVACAKPSQPAVLSVRRVRAEVSLGKALQKKIVVKSLRIEGMSAHFARDNDGEWNLPARTNPPAAEEEAKQREEDEPSWEFAVETISLVDCDARADIRDGYAFAAERIVGEVRQKPEEISVALLAASAGRVEPAVELGELRISAKFTGATKLTDVVDSPIETSLEIGDALKADVKSESIKSREFSVEVDGATGISQLIDLLPRGLGGIERIAHSGRAQVTVRGSYSPQAGARISEASVRVTDASATLTTKEKG